MVLWAIAKVGYRKWFQRRSMANQGLVPWWSRRGGGSVDHHDRYIPTGTKRTERKGR